MQAKINFGGDGMRQLSDRVREGKNFSAAQVGEWKGLLQYQITKPVKAQGKLFIKEELNCTGMEVSFNVLPPGKEVPFHHKHQENEELYIFFKGTGQFQIDGEIIEIREGTVIRVAPDGVRTWRNHSKEDLFFIVIQAKEHSLPTSGIEDAIGVDQPVNWPSEENGTLNQF